MVSCLYCSVELRDQYNLKNHHKSNHECNFCGTVFGQKNNLKMHKKICSKNKKAVTPCTTCGKSFTKYCHKVEHESICGIKKISKQRHTWRKLAQRNFARKHIQYLDQSKKLLCGH